MRKNKYIFIIIIVGFILILLGYYQSQKIQNKEQKIMKAYQLLENAQKQRIKDISNISKRSNIRKIKLRKNIKRYFRENEEYIGKTVYEVTFPIDDDGRPETEFMILYNLDLTEIVGYRGLD
ncbi:hypothetical protein [Candidatus Galacturonibacter soehngenii]|uniref:Uncharacterized protein n=1 Tax=Candidatus Galacturonatibacter soehngenii TaxID=2307010 RepID=A0A7V7QNQ0_9FIRM|nr:hypothetical protein [Candidatus Galacturonibacter soehngenii]KAB1440696.1 hypothetical protein F7O84_02400 [Candidatus Galacturonibacter soehngenii]MBA4688205.1 hypothetical protein [Candidatus Galacturonibacter soehngenii]